MNHNQDLFPAPTTSFISMKPITTKFSEAEYKKNFEPSLLRGGGQHYYRRLMHPPPAHTTDTEIQTFAPSSTTTQEPAPLYDKRFHDGYSASHDPQTDSGVDTFMELTIFIMTLAILAIVVCGSAYCPRTRRNNANRAFQFNYPPTMIMMAGGYNQHPHHQAQRNEDNNHDQHQHNLIQEERRSDISKLLVVKHVLSGKRVKIDDDNNFNSNSNSDIKQTETKMKQKTETADDNGSGGPFETCSDSCSISVSRRNEPGLCIENETIPKDMMKEVHRHHHHHAFLRHQKSNIILLTSFDSDIDDASIESAVPSGVAVSASFPVKHQEERDDTESCLITLESNLAVLQQQTPSDSDILTLCAICLNSYEIGDEICWSINSRCQHSFHHDCIETWLLKHIECPICRNDYLASNNDDRVNSRL